MNADPISRWYRWIEYAAFGRALERARWAFVDQLAASRRILIFGEGDGRTLARVLAVAPDARVDVVELSGAMIALARRRAGVSANRVRFHQINALTDGWPAGDYDGIVTHFFLDCFREEEVRQLIRGIGERMTAGAIWLVTDFAIPTRGWRQRYASILVEIMYRFFRATTGLKAGSLPDIGKLLSREGMERSRCIETRGGLIRAEIWEQTNSSEVSEVEV